MFFELEKFTVNFSTAFVHFIRIIIFQTFLSYCALNYFDCVYKKKKKNEINNLCN